ncbi:ras GEF [Clavulina sp. PMI_390]|nr:ras GEF [Clavulina sp. PMI_390]
MFKRSSSPLPAKETVSEPSRTRSRGPKLSSKLSDLGDRVRRIRPSPSQPNLSSSISLGHRTSISSTTSSLPPVPPIPPLHLPIPPPAPSSKSPISPLSLSSPMESYYLAPVVPSRTESATLETGTPPATPNQPRVLLGAKSMDPILSIKPSPLGVEEPVEVLPSTTDTTTSPSSTPTTPRRKKPTTRKAIEARKRELEEASASIVISPPTEVHGDGASRPSVHVQSSPDVASSSSLHPAAPSPIGPNPPSTPIFPRNYTLSTASAPSFTTSSSGASLARPHSNSSFAMSSESFKRFDTVPSTPPVPPIPEKYRYQPISATTASSSTILPDESAELPPGVNAARVTIAVVGWSKCGKSELIWKGMKVWGLSPAISQEFTPCGIELYKRVAVPATVKLPSTSPTASPILARSPAHHSAVDLVRKEEDEDVASTIHERRRIAEVTLYEVETGALLARRTRKAAEGPVQDEHDWVWPAGMPRIDGVVICYDVSKPRSVDGLDDVCAAYQAREIPALVVACKMDLYDAEFSDTSIGADAMSLRVRKFGMGLVQASARTERGKRAIRAAFKWVIRSILRNVGTGPDQVLGQKWRNPASPEFLRALPWEFGDDDVFTASTARAASPPPTRRRDDQKMPAIAATASLAMARSASSPSAPSPAMTPDLDDEEAAKIPAYLRATPSALPAVFVPDTPEYVAAQRDVAAAIAALPKYVPQFPSHAPREPSSSKPAMTPTTPVSESPLATSPISDLRGKRRESRQSLVFDTTNNTNGAGSASSSKRMSRHESAAPPVPPVPGSSMLGPSRAKSVPEFAARVRFQVDDSAAPPPPPLPESPVVPPKGSSRARRGPGGSILLSSITTAPPPKPLSNHAADSGPPSTSTTPPTPPPKHSHHVNARSQRTMGPPTLPPLDIPSTSTFAAATEDSLASASAMVRVEEMIPRSETPRPYNGSLLAAGAADISTPTSPQTPSVGPEVPEKDDQGENSKLRNMDSAALIEHLIAKTEKRKNRPILVSLNELLNHLVNMSFHTTQDPFIDTFLMALRVLATPREVIDGLHRRMRVIAKQKASTPPVMFFMHFGVCRFFCRWISEHPGDFGIKPANDELMKLVAWMSTQKHLLYYASSLGSMAKECAKVVQDPDCLYGKKDPIARPWQEIDDELVEADQHVSDSDVTEKDEPLPVAPKKKGFLAYIRRTKTEEDEEFVRKMQKLLLKEYRAATRSAVERNALDYGRKRLYPKALIVVNPIAAPRDDLFNQDTDQRLGRLLYDSPEHARQGEIAASKRLGYGRYIIRSFQQPALDVVLLRAPPVYNYTPLVFGPRTSRKDIIENLQAAGNVLLLADPQEIAEEINNVLKTPFLWVQPRDWIRHTYNPRRQIIDDEPGYVPPRLPTWVPEDSDLTEFGYAVTRLVAWSRSLIVAPDGFAGRARVVHHLINVAKHLRKLNNYPASHSIVTGIRGTLHDGDLMTALVKKNRVYNSYSSLSRLFSDEGGNQAYKTALMGTKGPAIADTSIHVTELVRWRSTPDFALDGSGKFNWWKWSRIMTGLRPVMQFQHNYHMFNTHDFILRPKLRRVIVDMPIMPDEILEPRLVPIDPRDGAEHPNREKIKRFLGIKPAGPAFNPASQMIPSRPPGFFAPQGIERYPLK